MANPGKRFRVAFSFAGEKRGFVAQVAALLAQEFGKKKILYDKFHEAEFAEWKLGLNLPDLYRDQSELIVVVVCPNYSEKNWCGLEWVAIHGMLMSGKDRDVMFCRFGLARLQALYENAGFVELDHKTPEQAAALILARYESNKGKNKPRKRSARSQESSSSVPTTPHNLPHLHSFFGRGRELKTIADALSPKRRTWGALIDGPGGMGKTSLAIRAAELTPLGQFQHIFFLSSKERKMTSEGERKRSDFVVPGYIGMLNEIARLLQQPDLARQPEAERSRLLIDALAPRRALLILDNLESLPKDQQNQLFEFLSQLPQGCKAIATSRRRTDVDARIIRLDKLEQEAALSLLDELAIDRPKLAKASATDRIHLYEETGGNPLLLRWIAGQLGRGRCRTVAEALELCRNSGNENDPLEFIFGDLLETFTDAEIKAVAALTYFTQPIEVRHIAELARLSKTAAQTALGDLSNRALVVPDEEEKNFALVPMVADFLRRKRPKVVTATGNRLEKRAFELVLENGSKQYARFPQLEASWPTVAPALTRFVATKNKKFQKVFSALRFFFEFSGRWDEWLSLARHAEDEAISRGDYQNAGKRAYQLGWIYYRYQLPDQIFACADRAAGHWKLDAQEYPDSAESIHNRACVIRLRGLGHRREKRYDEAIDCFQESLSLFKRLSDKNIDIVIVLNDIATAERHAKRFAESECYLRDALNMARSIKDEEGVASYTSGFAILAIKREDWKIAERYAREALPLSENVNRAELVARACHRLAMALVGQEKLAEALPYAQRAVEVYTKLGTPNLESARATLRECGGGSEGIGRTEG